LQKFGESPFGKALSVLDIGAEFTERAAGLASQFWNARDDPVKMQDLTRDLSAAWYAGGLAADMTNLPTFNYDDNGNVTNILIPNALPGAEGIVKARKDIEALVSQGATYSEALMQTKDEYYNSLGALQIRAQLYDLYSHILLDPVNFVLPYVKPIERLRVAADFASVTRWADDVILDSRKIIDTAVEAGDISKIAEVAQKTQKLTGKTLDAFTAAEKAGDVRKAAQITNKILDDVGLTTKDRIVLSLTGRTDPLKPESKWKRYNPLYGFGLTPEARASEAVTTLQDNIGAYIFARSDDPARITQDIVRASAGATGPELGHAFVTVEGRASQAFLKGAEIKATERLGQYTALAAERLQLANVADALKLDEVKVMGMLADGDFATVARLTNGAFAPEDLMALYEKLKDMPYSAKVFKFKLMNDIGEVAAQNAVLQFGVKQRGFAHKLAAAVKSAETLAFLRINPGYMIRNVFNNEMTIIGRGLGVNMDDIGKIVDDVLGFEPSRLKAGFGAIGDALGEPTDAASKVIANASRGERGFLDKATDALNRFKPFGKFDMGYLSAKAEANASQRAFISGYLQAWNRYFWKPGKGFDAANTYIPARIQDQINTIDKGLIPAVERAIASGKSADDIEAAFRGNLNLSLKNIMDDASAKLGYEVEDALDPTFVAKIEKGLQEAAEQGADATRAYFTRIRGELQEHLDELAKDTVKRVRDWTAAKVAAEGPGAFPKIWADQMDLWHEAGIHHAEEMEKIAEAIRLQTDPDIIHAMWKASNQASDTFYTRHWDRFDGTVQGMVKGAKAKGIGISDDVVGNFKDLKRGWRGFWRKKRKLQDDFWEAKRTGQTPAKAWDEIQEEVSKAYDDMVIKEDELTQNINRLVESSLPEEYRDSFRQWRQVADDLRRTDKEAIQAHWENIKGMDADERAVAWQEYWQGYIQRREQMRQWEHVGNSAMMDDEQAVQKLGFCW
jgi:hypothetical protein